MVKLLESKRGVILSCFQELQICRDTFYRVFFSTYFLCSRVYQCLYFMIYISMALMTLMMSTLATSMLFPQDIPNISLFPSMAVDLTDLATKDGTPFTRSIFDIYILLLDPCLNIRN